MDQTYMLRLPTGQEFGPATMDMLVSWAREGRVPKDALLVPRDSGDGAFALAPTRVVDEPRLASVVLAPPTVGGQLVSPLPPDSGVSTLIPYRNGAALAGYYVSVFSLIPGIGLILGPTAVVLGIVGFKRSRKNPEAKGAVHAWVAIILGGLVTLAHVAGIIAMALAIAAG